MTLAGLVDDGLSWAFEVVLPGFRVTADGSFVVTPAMMSSLVTPQSASEDAGTRVVRISWSRGPVVMSFEVVAVGCSLEAEEPVHSEFSRTMVKPTVAPVEAEEGPVCVSGGPS